MSGRNITDLDLARPHIKPKSRQTLEDRWYLCKYLTWEQNWEGKGVGQDEMVELLLRFMEEGWTKREIVEYYEEDIHDGRDQVLAYWQKKLEEEE